MTLQFPLKLTWAEIAALPNAADHFGWDESMIEEDDPDTTLEGVIHTYSEAFTSSDKLTRYLAGIGYELTSVMRLGGYEYTGISIRNEAALHMANAIFNQVCHEYDDPDARVIETHRYGGVWHTTPTWALFELGGDDDVDYCGSQPSCLTGLLLEQL